MKQLLEDENNIIFKQKCNNCYNALYALGEDNSGINYFVMIVY
jgi:hypothetical protein